MSIQALYLILIKPTFNILDSFRNQLIFLKLRIIKGFLFKRLGQILILMRNSS
jgi:hypothetical protein